ncbi:hypothetical protein [Staphylococcus xylosus]
MKFISKVIVISLSILFCGLYPLSLHTTDAKEIHHTEPDNIKLFAKYDKNQVDEETMNNFKEISKIDPHVFIKQEQGNVIVEDYVPNPDKKSETLKSDDNSNTKVINFSDFVGNMDDNNENHMKDGTTLESMSYKGQEDGQKVKKGTHTHCNRFNGTKSDHRYWSKKHPRAFTDFYKSDCDYHAMAYGCSSIGSMTKCDGLNIRKKGIKDCSSWKGTPKHKNWSKTVWYRN